MSEVMAPMHIHSVESREAALLIESHAMPADWGHAAAHSCASKARQTVLGRAMARQLIESMTGLYGPDWTINTDGKCRPFAVDGNGRQGPDFSISHSGPWVACAATDQGSIGIDIEVLGIGRSFKEIADAFFTPEEQSLIAAEGQAAFYDIWTMREAIGKGKGDGIAAALAISGKPLIGARHQVSQINLDGRLWSMRHFHLHGLSIAQAVEIVD
jgi:phosphopantetheinyl transferase